jgi:hypothetical protein
VHCGGMCEAMLLRWVRKISIWLERLFNTRNVLKLLELLHSWVFSWVIRRLRNCIEGDSSIRCVIDWIENVGKCMKHLIWPALYPWLAIFRSTFLGAFSQLSSIHVYSDSLECVTEIEEYSDWHWMILLALFWMNSPFLSLNILHRSLLPLLSRVHRRSSEEHMTSSITYIMMPKKPFLWL